MSRLGMDNYELLIFDMDGVLVDTSPSHRRAYEDLWSMIGVTGPRYETIAGRKTSEVVTTFAVQLKPGSAQIDEWTRFKQERARTYLSTEVITYDDTVPVLSRLARNKMPLALGTGASRETADLVLKQLGIFDFFSIIVTAGEVAKGKPSPEIYSKIMVQAAVDPKDTLIIEDSVAGLEAGVGSNAYVASVRTGREISHPRFVGSFPDLRKLLRAIGTDV
jgi:HAD superfamily hydrolase (TIGR01509 family)